MVQEKSCKGCSQAHDCKKIYEQLGHAGGPSVARKVSIAFGLPMVLFVAGLGVFGHLLRTRLAEPYQSSVAFILALTLTVGLMLLVTGTARRFRREP